MPNYIQNSTQNNWETTAFLIMAAPNKVTKKTNVYSETDLGCTHIKKAIAT